MRGGLQPLSGLAALHLGTQTVAEQRGDLTGLGVTTERLLREHELVVERHFEHAAARRNQLQRRDVRRPTLEYFVRQPDGTGCVVSDAAELDAEPVLGVGHRGESYRSSCDCCGTWEG